MLKSALKFCDQIFQIDSVVIVVVVFVVVIVVLLLLLLLYFKHNLIILYLFVCAYRQSICIVFQSFV